MIELNLLPDVKLEYIKAQRQQRLVLTVAILASALSVALLVLILLANGLQKKHLSDLSKDIKSESAQLQKQPEISKILTVQNQLQSLTGLHAGKPAASRLGEYLNSVTPTQVSISNLTVDFPKTSITITGSADALSSVNKYVDTLKFTTYDNASDTQGAKAFSNVVLTTFGLSSESKTGKASYSITLNYDKNIFDITKDTKLSVPNLTTTRSELNKPSDLFQSGPTSTSGTPIVPSGGTQ
jgi:hypothetical protein